MGELGVDDIREVFIGTWIGIAILINSLADAGFIDRAEILGPLAEAEAAVSNQGRKLPLKGIQVLVERLALSR